MKRASTAPAAGASRQGKRRRLFVLLALLVAALGFWAWRPVRQLWISRLSLDELAGYAAEHPGAADAALLLARRYLQQGDPARAESVLKSLVERDPADGSAWLLRSQAEMEQGKLAAAYASIQVALPLVEPSAEAHWRLGQLRERRGDEQQAEAEFRRALEMDPSHTGARLELARSALAHRHYGPAQEHLEAVLRRHPNHVEALELLSLVRRNVGDLQGSERYARRAVALAPGSARTIRALAQALHEQATPASIAEAEQLYRRLAALDPGSSDVRHQLGKIYFGRGEYEKAAGEFERAIELHPLNRLPYPSLIQCYLRLGKEAEARKLQREYERIDEMDLSTAPLEYSIYAMPENTALRMKLARLYLKYGRPDLAAVQVERVLELNAGHPNALRLREQLKNRKE